MDNSLKPTDRYYLILKCLSFTVILFFFTLLLPYKSYAILGIDTGLTGDDNYVNNLPIGFTFNYWGTDYTTFGVSNNGWISLRNTASGTYVNPDFPMTGSLDGLIAPFFDDLRLDASGQPTGKILYMTIGEEPNRQLIIQYHDVYFYGTDLPMGTFEVILSETSNEINFQYRYLRDTRSFGNSATIGIDSPTSTDYISYSYNTDSVSEQMAISVAPDGQGGYTIDSTTATYEWVDISGLTATSPSDGGAYASSEITFSWDAMQGANAYRIDIATAPNSASIIETIPLGNVTSYGYTNNLVEDTSYYARVAASLNNGGTYQNPSDFSDGILIDQTLPVSNQPTISAGTEVSTADITFSGTDNHGVASYYIQISTDTSFNIILFDTTITNNTYSYQGTPGEIIYVRAYAIDVAGNQGLYSDASDPFEIPYPPPEITSISPVNGPRSGGTAVTISGNNFVSTQGSGVIKFGSVSATSYTSWSNTQIVCVSPALNPGIYSITCTTENGSASLQNAFTSLGPEIDVSPASYNFRNAYPDIPLTHTFTVTNSGNADLILGTLSLSGADSNQFSIVNDQCSGQTLAGDATCTCDVSYLPIGEGLRIGTLHIPSDDEDEPEIQIALSGTGVAKQLTLAEIPSYVIEGDGVFSNTCSISIPVALPSDLTIEMTSDDDSEISVPPSVTIEAGNTSIMFDLTVVDDPDTDNTQGVIITAAAQDWNSDSSNILVMDDELVHLTIRDNENNDHTGTADGDMGKFLKPCVHDHHANHPIEFNIPVNGNLPTSNAYLSLFIIDIDWPSEVDEVFLNGHSLGHAIGENDTSYSTLFIIPDISWIIQGNNLVEIDVDQGDAGLCAIVQSGQLIFDDGAQIGNAYIQSAVSDATAYDYSDTVSVDIEVGTTIPNQTVRLELILRDPLGEIKDFDTNVAIKEWALTDAAVRPYQWRFSLPASGETGLWAVSVSVYDVETQMFQHRQTLTFTVPVGAENLPRISSVTPNTSLRGEAKAVVISGANFIPDDTLCTVGGVQLDNLMVVDNNNLTGNISVDLFVGSYDIECTTSFGSAQLTEAFGIVSPVIEIAPVEHDYGDVYLPDSESQTFTITNIGNADLIIGSHSLSGTDISEFAIQNDQCSDATLLPSESATIDIVFTPTAPGSKQIVIEIPSNDPVQPTLNVTVNGTGKEYPDLQLGSCTSPPDAWSGQQVQIGWEVSNDRGDISDTWMDKVYLSEDDQPGDDLEIASFTLDATSGSNGTYTMNEAITIPSTVSGSYWIIISTDAADELVEVSDDNNASVCGAIIVRSPDLVSSNLIGPETARIRETVEFSWQISNSGTVPAVAQWRDCLYLSEDNALGGDTQLACINHTGELVAGNTYSEIATFPIPASVSEGNYYVILKTDADENQAETDEANNIQVASIEITLPHFTALLYNDIDGSGSLSIGDEFHFTFSDPMETSQLRDGTSDADDRLAPTGLSYGTTNSIRWSQDEKTVIVTLTDGFTVTGSEPISIAGLTDPFGNLPVGNLTLTTTDTIDPEMQDIQANYTGVVPSANDFKLTLRFDTGMDPSVTPVIEMISSGSVQPVVPSGGVWQSTQYNNDTYITPDIVLTNGMDGTIQVNVSGAKDLGGNSIPAVPAAYEFTLDATPPVAPEVELSSTTPSTAVVTWIDYSPPSDLAEFQIFQETEPFTDIAGLTPIASVDDASATSYEFESLELNTSYYVAIVAVDAAGNRISATTAIEVIIVAYIQFDRDFYTTQPDIASIVLNYPDLNQDSATVETVGVKVISDSDPLGITIMLAETGLDTGRFSTDAHGKLLGFTTDTSDNSNKLIRVADTDTVYVIFNDVSYSLIRTDQAIIDNTPPVTTITPSEPFLTVGSDIYVLMHYMYTLAASDSASGVQRIEYSIDGVPFISYTNPFILDTGGSHTITFKSLDNAGNWETPVEKTVIVDTPPVAPMGLSASQVDFQIDLSWNANPESDISGYHIYRNGVKITASPNSGINYSDTAASGRTYIYNITAVDFRGNESVFSNSVSITTTGAPPVITSPVANTSFVDTGITVGGEAEAGATVEVFVNGASQGTAVAASNGSFSIPDIQLSLGANEITAISTNAYGVLSPVSSVISVPLDPRPQAVTGVAVTESDTVVTITWDACTESDVQGYNVYRDGEKLNNDLLTGTTFTDIGLSNGKTYSYTVFAVDANQSEGNPGQALTATPVAGSGW